MDSAKKLDSYTQKQDKWLKENKIKPRSWVRVVREAHSRENGWSNDWVGGMKVGTIFSIHSIRSKYGIFSGRYSFPYFVLEPVKVEKVGKVLDYYPNPEGDYVGVGCQRFELSKIKQVLEKKNTKIHLNNFYTATLKGKVVEVERESVISGRCSFLTVSKAKWKKVIRIMEEINELKQNETV